MSPSDNDVILSVVHALQQRMDGTVPEMTSSEREALAPVQLDIETTSIFGLTNKTRVRLGDVVRAHAK